MLKCLEYGKDTGCTQLLSYQDLPMEYKENDFFDVTEAITELIRYLRSGNKKKIFEQMQKIINETEKETEKYFNNIMELIGANIFFISFKEFHWIRKAKIRLRNHLSNRFMYNRKERQSRLYEILAGVYCR